MEKKNTGLIVLVVVLSIAILGLGGFIVYDKVLFKDSNIENVDKNESYMEQNKIVKKTEKLISNIPLIHKYEEKITDFNAIDNYDKITLAVDYIARNENSKIYNYSDKISVEKINNTLTKIFNDKISFDNENIMCCYSDEVLEHCHITYDEQNNQYISGTGEPHGYSETYAFYNKLINFEKVNNTYELTYIYLFDEIGDSPRPIGSELYTTYVNKNNPYIEFSQSDYDKMYDIYNKTGKTEIEQIKEVVAEKIENLDNYNEFPKYKYIVELDNNDNPKLVGYEFIDVK
ncbi:MAG: hypothetical protein IJO32_01710 [Bacilli bacterium]|nr:hypothetical protein [Bacilli bacterium]